MRRRQALQVSTFPFLAVLLCAMGSLILFLLVIDRRAKIVARAKAQAALQQVEKEDQQLAAQRAAELERRRQELRALLQNQLNQVEDEVRSLSEQIAKTTAAEDANQERQRELSTLIAKTEQEIERQRQGLIQRRADQAKKDWLNAKARAELQRLAAELAKLETTLADLRKLRSQLKETYSLVPYHGRYGDNRRPVYVECSASGIVLHPGSQELNAATASATEVRQAIDRRLAELAAEAGGPQDKKAYILLLIRPAGIDSFRLAATAMRGLDIDFGYELIEDDWVLDFNSPQAQPWTATATVKPAPKNAAPAAGPMAPGRALRPGNASPLAGDGSKAPEIGGSIGLPGGVTGWPGGNGSGPALPGAPGGQASSQTRWPGTGGHGDAPSSRTSSGIGRPGGTITGHSGEAATAPAGRNDGVPPVGIPSAGSASAKANGGGPGTGNVSNRARNGSSSEDGQPGSTEGTGQGTGSGNGSPGTAKESGALSPNGAPEAPRMTVALPNVATASPQPGTEVGGQGSYGTPSSTTGVAAPRPPSHGLTTPGGESRPPTIGATAPNQGTGAGTAKGQAEDETLPRKSRHRLTKNSANAGGEGGGSLPGDGTAGAGNEEGPPSLGGTRSGGSRPRQRPEPGIVTQMRDWTLVIDCTADEVTLSTGQKLASADWPRGGARQDHPLLLAVQDIIRRRAAAGKSSKPQIQFRVYPDGLRTYYQAFPALEPLHLLMKRENVDPDDEE